MAIYAVPSDNDPIEINGRLRIRVRFNPAVDAAVTPPITAGVETTDWLKYPTGTKPQYSNKAWVERHLGWQVQQIKENA